MPHYCQFPAASTAPTLTLVLDPSHTIVQEERIIPIQRTRTSESGAVYTFQLSANREQLFEAMVDSLPSVDYGSYDGFNSLKAFFASTGVNYSASTWTFRHTDTTGTAVTVRYISGLETFRESESGRAPRKDSWTGRIQFVKVLV